MRPTIYSNRSLQVIGDVTKKETLLPEYFIGVKKVINAVSVIIGPKEGDTPDRQKYNQVGFCDKLNILWVLKFPEPELMEFCKLLQGIKFFEPEVRVSNYFSFCHNHFNSCYMMRGTCLYSLWMHHILSQMHDELHFLLQRLEDMSKHLSSETHGYY